MTTVESELRRIRQVLTGILVCLILLVLRFVFPDLVPLLLLAILIYLPVSWLYRWANAPSKRVMR